MLSTYKITRTKTSIRYAKENYREKKEREGEREEEKISTSIPRKISQTAIW